MDKIHQYTSQIIWTGNLGVGTSSYQSYARSYDISALGKSTIAGSSDPQFRGDVTKWNPEDLLLSSISSCHMLWYLHLCADHHIIVEAYQDQATATMEIDAKGSGRFTEAILHPIVKIKNSDQTDLAIKLHEEAHHFCFIANSLNFDVKITPSILVDH